MSIKTDSSILQITHRYICISVCTCICVYVYMCMCVLITVCMEKVQPEPAVPTHQWQMKTQGRCRAVPAVASDWGQKAWYQGWGHQGPPELSWTGSGSTFSNNDRLGLKRWGITQKGKKEAQVLKQTPALDWWLCHCRSTNLWLSNSCSDFTHQCLGEDPTHWLCDQFSTWEWVLLLIEDSTVKK